ncbi:MAG: KUP/HAK/KT family potassium transporter [Spirochaetia bacterium]|nr:KUP/HAK/KT family potassium transporter [Spirochaetia bacterium]
METEGETLRAPTLLSDIRIIFATILTDPGSSLAYGADALIHVTVGLMVTSYTVGAKATILGGATVLIVYLIAILVYNGMSKHHTHKVLGGGAFVSAFITSQSIKHHPGLKRFIHFLGKMGTGSLLADFPATQAISLLAGVEALYFIPIPERLKWVVAFIFLLSFVQRFGLGILARYMIWPVLAFYTVNIGINLWGLATILQNGWQPPIILEVRGVGLERFAFVILSAVANGATLITGVEVGYSSVNIPHHRDRAIRVSMWILYAIVVCTYSMQIINFLGLGVTFDDHIPVPIQIAKHLGGDALATSFGILTAVMLLLAAQTAQTDFPLEMLRAARSNFFPRGIGDMAWKRTVRLGALGGHEGVYNPRATVILGVLTFVIVYFFPNSHAIESMYGLAVILTMNIGIFSYLLRQIRTRKVSFLTVIGMIVMTMMLCNIVYNKFFDGAWFVVVLLLLFLVIFVISEAIYAIWLEKLNVVPLELGLWFPAFQNQVLDEKNIVLVSKFHPGVIHFLKNYVKSGHIPLVVHFRTDSDEEVPREIPEWYRNIDVPESTDTITAITRFVRQSKARRVHLIPSMVRGIDPISRYYFGNSIERLKYAVSQYADLQVEYNKERIEIQVMDIARRIFPAIARKFKKRSGAAAE